MPANYKNTYQKIRGFTLVEIIVALFIFSLVSMIVVGALHNVLGTQALAEKKAVRLAGLQVALLFISRDLEQAINRPVTDESGKSQGFTGTSSMITFTHAGLDNPLGQLRRSTLQRTRYQLNGGVLRRFTWSVLDQATEIKPDARVLLNAVSDLRFEYLDDKNHFQTVWPLSSQKNAALPRAVRVSLTLRDWGKISQLYIIAGQSIANPN